jgi:hypothetical protein
MDSAVVPDLAEVSDEAGLAGGADLAVAGGKLILTETRDDRRIISCQEEMEPDRRAWDPKPVAD